MKGIVLAAGEGSRLRPLTDDRPKCMVEYRGKPILDYTIEAFQQGGLAEIIVVGGYKAEAIQRSSVRSYLNPRYASTNMVHTLFCAEEELTDDIIVSYGDIIYHPDILKTLIADPGIIVVVVDNRWEELWRRRMADPLSDAETMKIDPSGNIVELGKKPNSYADIQGQYIGLFKLARSILPQIRDFYHSLDRTAQYDGKSFDQMYMTSFLQLIADQLHPIRALPIEGGWLEIDSETDLECQAV